MTKHTLNGSRRKVIQTSKHSKLMKETVPGMKFQMLQKKKVF
jgi:hypothetical protein